MRIIEIKRTADGSQPRPYADHVYEWVIKTMWKPTRDEVLQFCLTYLEHAALERTEYLTKYRSNLPFNEHMQVVCGGWYTLTNNEHGEWVYHVQREYID